MVVVTTGAPVTMPWIDRAKAVVWAPFGGQEAGNGLADVLSGMADPGGRLPFVMVRSQDDVPSDPWFPGTGGEGGVVEYAEKLLVGQRGLDAAGTSPLFPFGHGTSYSSFEWGAPTRDRGRRRRVGVGHRAGGEHR